ncbi:hypothetical protein DMT42_12455 [Streptomyces actuosus]|uniref:Uncharacterized protein n=1 Tax=Streptomyces actuosus TaxID=1885 RepID=A0A2U9P0J7_STRAS|nr:hypothetical protein DMT42_12455 [Streptomyces actuosus]
MAGAVSGVSALRAVSAAISPRPGRTELFDGNAAARAGQGSVEVAVAGVAEVHDAGRLSSRTVPFLGTPVKVVWGSARRGAPSRSIRAHPVRTGAKAAFEKTDAENCRKRSVCHPLTRPPPPPYCHASISNV